MKGQGPYRVRKSRKNSCYRVKNRITKRIFSKCTTKEKGQRQIKNHLHPFLRNKLGNERYFELFREPL